jgi:hypothetical protein
MAQPKPPKHPNDKIEIEPGADKRLANILKRALNTPPPRHASDHKSVRKTLPKKG